MSESLPAPAEVDAEIRALQLALGASELHGEDRPERERRACTQPGEDLGSSQRPDRPALNSGGIQPRSRAVAHRRSLGDGPGTNSAQQPQKQLTAR